ncbi:hypothetical protein DFJ43DRAFT_1160928 [Lentinula guzmanii]|uniref:Uncharacterized protein n=1 Tax=Lentinula guzmanii TaxID=2804957 RepID=A0AA38J3K0_9AGAR|nr:hypothetical protein DFJ43DRAFT_1160928 [Lentinula guzmanii]
MYDSNPSLSTAFDRSIEDNQITIIVDIDFSQLNSAHPNLRDAISLALVSGILGPSPSVEQLNLAFVHAHAFFSYDTSTYNSFIHCAAISSECQPKISNLNRNSSHTYTNIANTTANTTFAASKKKYKPVHRRVRPIQTTLPENFCVVRSFPTNPLANLPLLNPNPPDFVPTGRYTQERKDFINTVHDSAFIWPEEMKAIHHLMMLHERAFAWSEEEKGQFNPKYFPPVEFPVIC